VKTARWVPDRALARPPRAPPSPFLPPLFSPFPPSSLPPSPAAATAATRPEKKFGGRWVIRRALGACDWPPNGRWVGRWVVSLWGGVGWVLGPATECRRLRVQLRGALGAIPPWGRRVQDRCSERWGAATARSGLGRDRRRRRGARWQRGGGVGGVGEVYSRRHGWRRCGSNTLH